MLRCRYFCSYGDLSGFGRAARDYLAALHAVEGVELEIAVLGNNGTLSPEPRYGFLDDLAVPFQEVKGEPDVEIYHSTPRVLEAVGSWRGFAPASPSSRRVALTTWETSILPTRYARSLMDFDAVIVPSDFCAEIIDAAFQRECTTSVRLTSVISHCFDEGLWTPQLDRTDARTCRFYSIGAWGERKNMLGILRAYLHEFTKRDRVQLMMLIADADFDEIRSVITRSGLSAEDLPAITVPSDALTEDQLMELHATADCYVSATRGEGFGLGLFEAAISGRQIISPLWGGQADFLDEYVGCQAIPYHLTPCFGAERSRDGGAVTVAIAPGVDCRQAWADPDLVALAGAMRAVYEDRADSANPQDRAVLEARFGYKTIGPKFANLLREICFQ